MEDPKDPAANSNVSKRPRPTGATPAPAKEGAEETTAEKKVERIVAEGGVVVPKKGLGRKIRSIFTGADARGALHYVAVEVLGPTIRNLVIDATTKGIEHLMYPDSSPGRSARHYGAPPGHRASSVSYSGASYRPSATRPPSGRPIEARVTYPQVDEEYVLVRRTDAVKVLERMHFLLETYNVVTVADLHELIGRPITHTENKFGWDTLRGVEVVPHKDGWLLTLGSPGELNF